jgi:hypothetical protein
MPEVPQYQTVNGDMRYEIAKAVAELNDTCEFLEEVSKLPYHELVEKVAERDPAFIAYCESTEYLPRSAPAFHLVFSFWTISVLKDKYHHIWPIVVDSYFQSELHRKSFVEAKLKGQLNQILKDSGFE